ncbi:MAG: CDP-alcohol phosphatidyltransferase family protein [Chthoniobacterales bacterium]|nr:CDP-alcohol phosphatidyltransferase family protein [Chthoniobacterales bacterium]
MISEQTLLQRVLVLADESADWHAAGLPQLHRILLCLNEYTDLADQRAPISVSVQWKDEPSCLRAIADDPRLANLEVSHSTEKSVHNEDAFDLVLSTRVFLYRNAIAPLLEAGMAPSLRGAASWEEKIDRVRRALQSASVPQLGPLWRYLLDPTEIPACERAFLRHAGKSQDGLVSRHLNRPISRFITHSLLRTNLMPTTWSLSIFVLPLAGSFALLQGTALSIIIGCLIFQLYSILDGCDGEIARAKFLHTDSGRRLDSMCDLIGNVLLAVCLGLGLARYTPAAGYLDSFYIAEGLLAGVCVLLSEGIVFLRRSRTAKKPVTTALNGALYHRHHEFFHRSGILMLGETVAWWLVVMTKRDMAILAFLVLAIAGWPELILHLLLGVGAISSALAGNAFFRAPAAALPQEAS